VNLTLSLRDGALGYSAAQAEGLAFIGVCTLGTVGQLVPITDPRSAVDLFGTGKLVDRIAFHLANGGPSPVYAMRATAANAGTMPSYQVQASGTRAGNSATNTFPTLVQPTATNGPRNIEITFAAAWDGGNVALVGTDKDGNAVTETITASAGTTVKGLRVFAALTSATKGAVGAAADTAQLFWGNKTAEGGTSTDSKLSVATAPLDDYEIIAQVTRAGDVASGDPAAKYSFDGGETFGPETAIPAGGVYSGFASTHGLTFTWVGAALKVGDAFAVKAAGPTMDTSALSAALASLHADATQWEGLHILGALTGSQGAVVESWHGTCRSEGRFAWTMCESRDQTLGESIATWQAAVKSDYASVTSTYGQLSRVDGYIETVIPGKGIFRRSHAWASVTQISRVPLSQHPGQPLESGPLRGVYKPAGQAGLYHDERINPGMGGPVGRGLTAQTLLGRPGQFFIGDATGLRSPGTLASSTSDYSLHMNVRVILLCCRLMQEVGTGLLARRLATKQNGTLLESEAKKLDEEVTSYLRTYLLGPGHAVEAYAVVSRSWNVLSTKKLPFQVFVRPFGYSLAVEISIGFEKVLV